MYKQDYMSYHIAGCKNLSDLILLLNGPNMPIVSSFHGVTEEYSKEELFVIIKAVYHHSNPLGLVPRSHGLRAKVAELVLTKNYGDTLPEELKAEGQK